MSKLTFPHHSLKFPVATAVLCGLLALQGQGFAADPAKSTDAATVRDEHDAIGVGQQKSSPHTTHPDAQWFPDAGCGLFIHWGLSSVKAMNISWPMIPGRPLAAKRITDPAERERILREGDWNLTGKKPEITPNEYWAMAKDFNPSRYDPDKPRSRQPSPCPSARNHRSRRQPRARHATCLRCRASRKTASTRRTCCPRAT